MTGMGDIANLPGPKRTKPAAAPKLRVCSFCRRLKAPEERVGMCRRCRTERDVILAEDGIRARPCPEHAWQYLSVTDERAVICVACAEMTDGTGDAHVD